MDRTTELVTIQETARLIRVTYPRVAPRLAAHATKAIALFDLHTEARQNGGKSAADEIGLQITDSFAEWVKLRNEDTTWRNLIAKVAKLVGLALPHMDNTLRFVKRDSEAWHSIPCFDWEAAKAELLRIESEAVAALARFQPEVTEPARQPTAPVAADDLGEQPEDRTDTGQDELPDCLVTLHQAAAIVNRSKRTLESWAKKKGFPRPKVIGGGGKPHEYKWDELRPFLERQAGRNLPQQFPAQRFRVT